LDIVLGLAFLATAIVAARRMAVSRQQQTSGAAETAVVTAFYSLILVTSALRALWFFVPAPIWSPSYTPVAVYVSWATGGGEKAARAPSPDEPVTPTAASWMGAALSELVVTAGSLTLFSIFILILVYWADILKKYFHPGSRRSLPMMTFLILVLTLVGLELINVTCFLFGLYTTEGMILYNAVLLAIVSLICVAEITIFSHRFRTVLKTLGAINQVSTDSQVKRIVWITVTGNLFFVTRAILECAFAGALLWHYHLHKTVAKAFTHTWWDVYTGLKYGSEVAILALMLYILQSRFTAANTTNTTTANAGAGASGGGTYQKVPNAEPRV